MERPQLARDELAFQSAPACKSEPGLLFALVCNWPAELRYLLMADAARGRAKLLMADQRLSLTLSSSVAPI